MKKLFTFVFFLVTFNCFGQNQLQLKESYPDSISVLNDCKWQLSKAKYLDRDGKRYQVFLDTDLNEAFLIKRIGRKKFKKVYL
jgi:hypothetical protein